MNNNSQNTKQRGYVQLSDGYLSRTPIMQFLVVCMIFPLWGAAASLNDILITQFKTVFTLSDTATAFVQSAFYGAYFLIAIPASIVIKNKSYKFAILTGLTFYIVGCGLFFPASQVATYSMFLVAIFAVAVGLSFLETSCDTYASMLGPKDQANRRLNFAQTLVPLGDILGIVLGKYFIFSGGGNLANKMTNMSPAQRQAYGEKMLQLTLKPYKFILVILVIVFIVLAFTKMPSAKAFETNVDGEEIKQDKPSMKETFKYLSGNHRFKKGVFAQFMYVGMQTTVWSFTIRLALDLDKSMPDSVAANFMIFSYVAWFIGKLVANYLMNRYSITKVLT